MKRIIIFCLILVVGLVSGCEDDASYPYEILVENSDSSLEILSNEGSREISISCYSDKLFLISWTGGGTRYLKVEHWHDNRKRWEHIYGIGSTYVEGIPILIPSPVIFGYDDRWSKELRLGELYKITVADELQVVDAVAVIGKENYAEIEENLIWSGERLININEVMEEIMYND